MNPRLLLFSFILLAAFAAAPTARAEGNFTFTYQDRTLAVDAATVDSWRGVTRLPKHRQVYGRTLPLRNQVSAAVGRQLPTYQETVVYSFRPERVYRSVKKLTGQISVQPQEPVLTIVDGRATEFTPPRDGLAIHVYETAFRAIDALTRNQGSAELVVTATKPRTSLAQTNALGIRELVASGESTFKGSPRNRRTNIKVGVGKMKGIIVAPGEEFSFNKYLGPVEAEYGFVPELVIKRTGTVPELGGGLCQVSSTAFRAAVNGGLPITQRKNHAYAVQYYAPQGTDATIYPGVVDLKFLNDTAGHLLVWPYLKDDNTLVFEFYGTKDARTVLVEKPTQYDRKSDGSLKATWKRTVIKDGQEKEDVFKSVYLPPALFHKEETFVSSTTPTTVPGTPAPTVPTTQTSAIN